MIEFIFISILPCLVAAIAMVVLRAGASQVFFDVVGSFQATRLIADAEAKVTVLQSLMLDGLSSIQESAGALSQQMSAVVDATVPLSREIAEARLEFEKFANFAGGDEVAGAIEKIGLAAGFSADQALTAGARMAQLSAIVGGGAGVAAATQTGIEFGLIGGMGTEDAMKRMISLQQQTNFMYGELTQGQINRLSEEERANVVRANSVKLMDELNTIENRSAATMSQITFVMNQYASSAQLAGESTQFMAAMSATLIEAGEEQGKAGRALRMMYARLGANTGESAELLAKHGIAVKDDNDQLRSMEDILGDVSKSAIMNNKAEKMRVAQAIAGNDHYVRAIKLMDNYDRAMELSTEATQRLDTAQEELNRRYEDQAFQLTQTEAKLDNASARLGNHFIPGVIFATNTLANLTNAMAEMGEESEAVGGVLKAAATVNAFGKIFAPLAEGMLNIMSLNVSLRTQKALLRAINGEEIVRANAYGSQKGMAATTMGLLAHELDMRDREVTMSILSMEMKREQLTLEQQIANLQNAKLPKLDAILQKEKQLQQALQQQLDIERQVKIANEDPAYVIQMANEAALLDTYEAQLNTIYQMNTEKRLINYYTKQGMTEEQAKAHIMTKQDNISKNILRQNKVKSHLAQTEIAETATIVDLNMKIADATGAQFFISKNDLKQTIQQTQSLKDQLATQQQIKAEKGRQVLLSMQHSQVFSDETNEAKILQMAHIQAGQAVKMKSNVQQQNKVVTDAMREASIKLAQALGLEASAVMNVVATMPAFTNILNRIKQQNDAVVASSMAAQQSMMKMSIGLGALSMGVGMFSENEKAARISAILMTASMIPATIQMFTMTKATLGQASANAVATVTTKGFTASIRALIATTGPMIAIFGAIAAFVHFTKDEFDEAANSAEEYGQAVSYTAQQYADAQERYMGRDAATLAENTRNISANVLDLEKQLANAADDTNKKVIQARLDLLMQERAIMTDIMNLESARGLLENDNMANKVFGLSRELMAAEALEAQAKKEDGRITLLGETYRPNDKMNDMFGTDKTPLGMLNFNIGKDNYVQQFTNDTQAILDKIPEQYRGAILDIAKASDDAEEFMEGVAQFAEESGSEFGSIFGNMGNSIEDDFIGPIEAAKEAIFEFNSEREELFFGMSKGNLTGDMVKQVVNKGVETLINTTEVIMTNNFAGMTTQQAAKEITAQIVVELNGQGLNIKNNGLGF